MTSDNPAQLPPKLKQILAREEWHYTPAPSPLANHYWSRSVGPYVVGVTQYRINGQPGFTVWRQTPIVRVRNPVARAEAETLTRHLRAIIEEHEKE
jgi:hypothetical protein